jgi:hypothetical protein
MNATVPTSAKVREKLDALGDLRKELNAEAFELSLLAVTGDAAAIARTAEIRHALDGLAADEAVLRHALVAAGQNEAAQQQQAAEERREASMRRVENAARELISECARVDAAVDAVVAHISAIGHLQLELRSTLRAAGIDDAAAPSMLDAAKVMMNSKLNGIFISDDRPIGERAALFFSKYTKLLPEDGE